MKPKPCCCTGFNCPSFNCSSFNCLGFPTAAIASIFASVILLICSPAFAGPYLNTSAILLNENANAGRWVRLNLGDKELARNARLMAQARSDVAASMNVPSEVHNAHPHLLLALSAMENAMQAAADGKPSDFIRQLQTSTGEAATFQAILRALGFALPDPTRVAMVHAPSTPKLLPFALDDCLASDRPRRSNRNSSRNANQNANHNSNLNATLVA